MLFLQKHVYSFQGIHLSHQSQILPTWELLKVTKNTLIEMQLLRV